MERPTKRPRLFAQSIEDSDEDELEYYETPGDEVDEYEGAEDFDPVEDLHQKRAQLDCKLKSTFESIFEKYGRDFDGVGDEIDLATGEIVVNNGHLVDMRNERDAGDHSRARDQMRLLPPDDITSSSVGEDYSEVREEVSGDSEDEDDGDVSEEDMIEDDLILRGFAQATRFIPRQTSVDAPSSNEGSLESLEAPRRIAIPCLSKQKSLLPFRKETSPFGHEMGSHIFNHVKEQRPFDDYIESAWRVPPLYVQGQRPLDIEPAWRAPPLAPGLSTKRPNAQSVALQLQTERSTSPENATSLWSAHPFVTAPSTRPPRARPVALQPSIEHASPGNAPSVWNSESKLRIRNDFTKGDNETLLNFVAESRRQGYSLSSLARWKNFGAMVSLL